MRIQEKFFLATVIQVLRKQWRDWKKDMLAANYVHKAVNFEDKLNNEQLTFEFHLLSTQTLSWMDNSLPISLLAGRISENARTKLCFRDQSNLTEIVSSGTLNHAEYGREHAITHVSVLEERRRKAHCSSLL